MDSASVRNGLITGKPESVGMSSERLERINTVVQNYVDSMWISGATGFIARHGKIVYHQSFGMRDIYIKTSSPQLRGKIERPHRLDPEEFYPLLVYIDYVDLIQKLGAWPQCLSLTVQ